MLDFNFLNGGGELAILDVSKMLRSTSIMQVDSSRMIILVSHLQPPDLVTEGHAYAHIIFYY